MLPSEVRQNEEVPASVITDVLDAFGVSPARVLGLKDVQFGNSSWLVDTQGGERVVLRR